MNYTSPYRYIELFHLMFLRFLEHQVPKGDYALKGGCNLRFFFNSIRYSEDIDLDVWDSSKDLLNDRVTKILEARDFQNALLAKQLVALNVRAHKQSDTTQRWKMSIRSEVSNLTLPTKIEFSRRASQDEHLTQLEQVNPEITTAYDMPPVLVTHYKANAASDQKLIALLNRRETQARDIFDLYLLAQRGAFPTIGNEDRAKRIETITDRILSIDYETFYSQVAAFLEPSYQHYYDNPERWETIQLELIGFMEKAP